MNNQLSDRASAFQADLNRFFDRYTDIPKHTTPTFKWIDGALIHPNETRGWITKPYSGYFGPIAVHGEATLDLDLVMPMIYPQNVMIFQSDDPHYALRANAHETGWFFNDFLDAIDGPYCKTFGLAEDFPNPNHRPVYPDPVPPNRYNGTGSNETLQCGVFRPTPVLSVSYGLEEVLYMKDGRAYFERQCMDFLKPGLQGTSIFFATGDDGVGPCYNYSKCTHDKCLRRALTFPLHCFSVVRIFHRRTFSTVCTASYGARIF